MKHDIVVIGASAGGFQALRKMLSALPRDFPAAVFVTLHTAPAGPSHLTDLFSAVCRLPVQEANEQPTAIRPGRIYVAKPNLHLILKRGYAIGRFLPKENGTRPAIDPMFRSASHSYAKRVIGVLLTGNLDDGTAGLGVIKDEGGITVVQDPADATYPNMPLSAIKGARPDYVVPLGEMARLLVKLVETELAGNAEMENSAAIEQQQLVVTCPGCGGVLRQYSKDRLAWYMCMVGHRFTSETMMLEQNAVVEEHFWRLIAILKEKESVSRTLASDARSS